MFPRHGIRLDRIMCRDYKKKWKERREWKKRTGDSGREESGDAKMS